MEENKTQTDLQHRQPKEFHKFINAWLIIIFFGNMIRALFAFFKYSDNVYIGLYTFILCGLASWFAFELRFSKKRKWFILLSVLAVVNSVELTCVGDPVRAIMQVFMLVVLLLVFRLKKNGKSGYQTMKM